MQDFFSFCGKITNLSITPVSSDASAEKSATVTFEKETAAKTALLLDNTQLGKSQVHVSSASTIDQVATQAGSAATSAAQTADHDLSQEDKPRSRIAAEYLAHGYALSDNVLQKALDMDKQHGYSNKFTSALQNFDQKYKVTDKAQQADQKYQVSNKAWSAWGGLTSYFEKAMNTPSGQKVRDFYVQGEKQVMDVHSEARRLADLKKGDSATSGSAEKSENPPQAVSGTSKTVCTCAGKDGVCGCAPGQCACAGCSKSDDSAVTEVKEAAQASGQHLPKETFGATA